MDYLKTRELYHAFGDWGKRRKKNQVATIPVFDRNGVLQQPTRTSNDIPENKVPNRDRTVSGKANLSGIGSDQPMLSENQAFASKLASAKKTTYSRNEWVAKSAECTTRINALTAQRDKNPNGKSASFNPVIVAMRNAKGHCDEMAKSYANDINAKTKSDLEAARAKVARLNQVGEANVARKLAEEKKKRRQDTIRKFFRHSAMSTNDYTAVSELYHKYTPPKYKAVDGSGRVFDKIYSPIEAANYVTSMQVNRVDKVKKTYDNKGNLIVITYRFYRDQADSTRYRFLKAVSIEGHETGYGYDTVLGGMSGPKDKVLNWY